MITVKVMVSLFNFLAHSEGEKLHKYEIKVIEINLRRFRVENRIVKHQWLR